MRRRYLDTVVWGLVGGLTFLVAIQGFELASGTRLTLLVKFGVAAVVTVAAALLAHAVRRRQRRKRTDLNDRPE